MTAIKVELKTPIEHDGKIISEVTVSEPSVAAVRS